MDEWHRYLTEENTDIKQAREKMFNVTSHYRNVNLNYEITYISIRMAK